MTGRRVLSGLTASLLAMTLVTGCSGSIGSAAEPATLSVFGAASLKDVLAEVREAYELAEPGVTLTVATDSSATLRTQIEHGAPADVFLAADEHNPDALVDAELAHGDLVVFARTPLTIVVPADNPAGIANPADLADPGVRIIAAHDEVPISTYAGDVVRKLAALPGYPPDFAAAYAANVVSREENVKAVVTKVALGEGDAAIVYRTDVTDSDAVRSIDVPPEANVLATYAGVVIRASGRTAQARAFLDWLAGPDGQAVLAGFGFLPPA